MTKQTQKIASMIPAYVEFKGWQDAIDRQQKMLEEEKKDLARDFYGNEKRRIKEEIEELKLKRTKTLFRISALTEELCKKDVHYVRDTYFDAKKNVSDYTSTHSKGKRHYIVERCMCCGKVTRVIEKICIGKRIFCGQAIYEYLDKDLPERSFSDFSSYKMEKINFGRLYADIERYFLVDYDHGNFINLDQNDARTILESLKGVLEEKFNIEKELKKHQEALETLCRLFGHDIDEEVLINDQPGTCKCCGKVIETIEYIEQCKYAQYINLLSK